MNPYCTTLYSFTKSKFYLKIENLSLSLGVKRFKADLHSIRFLLVFVTFLLFVKKYAFFRPHFYKF